MPLTTYLSSVLQFLLPRSCLCGVAAHPWPCPGPLQERACLAYNRFPRCSKAPPPFACLMLSVRGGRGDLRNHQRTLGLYLCQGCEHNAGFISFATRCIQVQKPETSALMSCAFNICERQTACRSTCSAYLKYFRHLWSKIKTAHHTTILSFSLALRAPVAARAGGLAHASAARQNTLFALRHEEIALNQDTTVFVDMCKKHVVETHRSLLLRPGTSTLCIKRCLSLPGSTSFRAGSRRHSGSRGHRVRARA